MSLITDLRAVSENAVEQLAARFSDLPRPLLAAIGAGDLAIERLAELRESLGESVSDRVGGGAPDAADFRTTMSDLPHRAQKVAADVAGSLEQFAIEAPGKAQELIAQLPNTLTEMQTAAQSLSPDAVKQTVDAYTQLVGTIYGNLADRGDQTWTKVRASGLRPGTVVEAARVRPTTTPEPVSEPAPATPPESTTRPNESKARAPRRAAPQPAGPPAAGLSVPGSGVAPETPTTATADMPTAGTATADMPNAGTANAAGARSEAAAKKATRKPAANKPVVPRSPTLKVTDKPGADMPVVTPIQQN
jgi:hypothetical protein